MTPIKPITIMLVEDDPGDQKLIKQSLLKQRISNEIHITSTGEEALEFLEKAKDDVDGFPVPDLILLDLNMPGIGGKEFLKCIKADNQLDTIPVVILTTSDSDQDIIDSYKLHASGYIKKPVSLIGFKDVLRDLEEYWFVICKRVTKEQMFYMKS